MPHCGWIRSFCEWATAAYPLVIGLLGFATVANVAAARFIFALPMPQMPQITKVRLLFKAEPPVSSRASSAPH